MRTKAYRSVHNRVETVTRVGLVEMFILNVYIPFCSFAKNPEEAIFGNLFRRTMVWEKPFPLFLFLFFVSSKDLFCWVLCFSKNKFPRLLYDIWL